MNEDLLCEPSEYIHLILFEENSSSSIYLSSIFYFCLTTIFTKDLELFSVVSSCGFVAATNFECTDV